MSKTVLITGASRGIGLELARQAAAAGDRVLATARVPARADQLQEAAADTGTGRGRIEVMAMEVSDPASVEAAAQAEGGAVDVLICNAGQYLARGGIGDPDHTRDAWSDVLMTNIAGPFFVVRAFLPHLQRSGAGKVAIVSSNMGSTARAPGGSYIYRASKAGATNLARNLAADLQQHGIAVGAYHPGWVRTNMGGSAAEIGVVESAKGLLARIDALSPQTTGVFEDYRGIALAY